MKDPLSYTTIDDLLVSLSPEELAKVPDLTEEEIREALAQGKKEYDAIMAAEPSLMLSKMLFR